MIRTEIIKRLLKVAKTQQKLLKSLANNELDPPASDEELQDIKRIMEYGVTDKKMTDDPGAMIKSNFTIDKADIWYTFDVKNIDFDLPDTIHSQLKLKANNDADVGNIFLIIFPDGEFVATYKNREFICLGGQVHDGTMNDKSHPEFRNGYDEAKNDPELYISPFFNEFDQEYVMNNGAITTNSDMLSKLKSHKLLDMVQKNQVVRKVLVLR